MEELRKQLVKITLAWECRYGVAPRITATVSEYDAAILVGMREEDYSEYMQDKTAVSRGWDFEFKGIRYQIKGTRPSGKPGSEVKKAFKLNNYNWDVLIWINYNKNYEMVEAWAWKVKNYEREFDLGKSIRCEEVRREGNSLGEKLYPIR